MPTTNTVGFGTGSGEEGVVVTPQDAALAQNPSLTEAEDIHAIRLRYVIPAVNQPTQFNLAQNRAAKIDCSQFLTNSILITVNSGVLFYWFGDFTSVDAVAQTFSHGVCSAGVLPQSQQIVLPPGSYIFTLQANGGAATGYFTAMAL